MTSIQRSRVLFALLVTGTVVLGLTQLARPAAAARPQEVHRRFGPVGLTRGQKMVLSFYTTTGVPEMGLGIKAAASLVGIDFGFLPAGEVTTHQLSVTLNGDVVFNQQPVGVTVPDGERLELTVDGSILARKGQSVHGTLQIVDLDTQKTGLLIDVIIAP